MSRQYSDPDLVLRGAIGERYVQFDVESWSLHAGKFVGYVFGPG